MSDVPIGDHAFLSDVNTSALVTLDGSVDWLALPRFDSPPVLARLLDDDAGHLLLRPTEQAAIPLRRYLPHSLVLETTWTTTTGRVVIEDAMMLGEDERGHDIGQHSPGVLLRHARCADGEVEMTIEWAPRPEFGLVHPRLTLTDGGVIADGGPTRVMLSSSTPLTINGPRASTQVILRPGEAITLAIEQADGFESAPPPWPPDQIAWRLRETERAWQSWSALHQTYRGPFEQLVHQSGLVLQGLSHARTGAIVAAATTSLREGIGTGRNWDYRYTWVRDASMTMRGLWVAACPDEAARFFGFLARAAGTQLQRGIPLQIMFGAGAERDLAEHELTHLRGWRGSGPVRVGNAAWTQQQQDVYGALLDAAFVLRNQLGDVLEEPTRELLIAAVEAAASTWRQPDQGLWEIRGPARRFTHSALMCWIALDRGIALAGVLRATERVTRWSAERDVIRDTILDLGWDDQAKSFTQSFGSPDLDAATLLIGLSGMLPPSDPRIHSTIDAVRAGLSDDRGLLQRYRRDELGDREGSFLLCSFWLAEALARAGRTEEAHEVLDNAVSYANDLGLFSEEVDEQTGEQLGNTPQAFSHLGFVLAAQAISDAPLEQ